MLMQLFLVNNDPLDTLLVSQDGEPRYTIRSSVDTHTEHTDSFPISQSPDSYSESSTSFSSNASCSNSSSSNSSKSSNSYSDSSASSIAPTTCESTHPPPTHLGYRQPPPGLHPAIPITRTHSNPHPDSHKYWPDPSSPHPSPILPPSVLSSSPSTPAAAGSSRLVTTIRRLERHNSSSGNVETEVARVEYCGDDAGTSVQLSHLGMELYAPAVQRRKRVRQDSNSTSSLPAPPTPAPSTSSSESRTVTAVSRRNDAGTALAAFRDFCLESQRRKETSTGSPTSSLSEPDYYDEDEFVPDPTWSFKGPDNHPYKWISLASNPVLVNDTQPPTPLACYRPAKLGIVSRSRRGFLEILPEGLEKEDWIVATFAGYFRMKLGDRMPVSPHSPSSTTNAASMVGLPMGMSTTAGGALVSGARKSHSMPTKPGLSPPPSQGLGGAPASSSCPPKLATSPSALACLQELRRKNKNYGLGSARRTC